MYVISLLVWGCSLHLVRCVTQGENGTYSFSSNLQHVLSSFGLGRGQEIHDREYLKRSIVSELSQRLSPQAIIKTEDDEGFAAMNERYTDYKRPTYIAGVLVAEENDVIETVNYARMRGIQFQAQTGRHSLTSSLRSVKNALVIDMRGLNTIRYDKKKEQVTIGGGVVTGEFANATFSKGMEVTVGSCPCTGVLGISLGAGIGRLQGKYGYLNDNMVSIRLLLANGTVITASETSNKDIFWAVRGAGHNFGIGLEATFQVYPQQNNGLHYVVDFEFELDKVEEIFNLMNEVSSPMAKEVAVFVIGRKRGAKGGPTININIVYSGPTEEATPMVDRFQALGPVHRDEKVSAWDALPWATYNGLNNILCTPQGWARMPIKNFYGANVERYHIPTMRKFIDGWREMNEKYDGEAMFSFMFESFPQQAVRAKDMDSTAYPWRHGSDHFLMMEASYRVDSSNAPIFDSWLSKQQDSWIETSGYGRLQQYVNYGHGSKDPPEALYGYEPWRLERLRALKVELDPEGWFNGYQPFVVGVSSEWAGREASAGGNWGQQEIEI
ncbi:FAD binding domain-containing protein [Xylariaceae sp. AK1471]|nr:FAD binding domain-containing protein [Xylariaceae sp. AK1471]